MKINDWSDIFYYCDGAIYWKIRTSNRVKIGSEVKTVGGNGYKIVGIYGVKHLVHRIIWEMHNGKIPDGMQIGHIDHNKTNNKIDNLRLVTPKENNHNMKFRVTNKSGVTGVSWDKQHKKWASNIKVDGVKIHLGLFSDLNMAAEARRKAEVKYDFHENHGK